MLPDLHLRSFDVLAAHVHRDIDGEVYMESPSDYGDSGSVLEGDGTVTRQKHMFI